MTNIKDLTEYRLTKVEDKMATYEQNIEKIFLVLDEIKEQMHKRDLLFEEKMNKMSLNFEEKMNKMSLNFEEKISQSNLSWRNWLIATFTSTSLLLLGGFLRPWFINLFN
jgi:hypothetical protein